MKEILIIFLALLSSTVFAQKQYDSTLISPELLSFVNKIEGEKKIITSTYRPNDPKGNTLDYIALTKHPSVYVRNYAYTRLINNDTFNILPHIIKSLNDKEYICSGGCVPACSSFTDHLIYLYKDKLTEKQKYQLDSILFFEYSEKCYHSITLSYIFINQKDTIIKREFQGPCNFRINIEYRDKLLLKDCSNIKYYNRLKILLTVESNPILLYAISKFDNDEDTSIIINTLKSGYYEDLLADTLTLKDDFIGLIYNGAKKSCYYDLTYNKSQFFWCYKSIFENPRKEYFMHLIDSYQNTIRVVEYYNDYEEYMFFCALLKYREPETLNFIEAFLDNSINYHKISAIWQALQVNQDNYFNKIREKVSELVTDSDKESGKLISERLNILGLYE